MLPWGTSRRHPASSPVPAGVCKTVPSRTVPRICQLLLRPYYAAVWLVTPRSLTQPPPVFAGSGGTRAYSCLFLSVRSLSTCTISPFTPSMHLHLWFPSFPLRFSIATYLVRSGDAHKYECVSSAVETCRPQARRTPPAAAHPTRRPPGVPEFHLCRPSRYIAT